MSKIVFFSIAAHGHTNPTIAVVEELVRRGNTVWYYSFDEFKDRIEGTGAKFISCDAYLPEFNSKVEKKIGKDFSALIEMSVDVTLNSEEKILGELRVFNPDCIVYDSVCTWGKLFAQKLGVPSVCSTTTFAMNNHSAKLMKQGFKEIFTMILGIPKVNRKIKELRNHGYVVESFLSLIQNDNETDTIVYTSREFQPFSETFSSNYAFIGPSIKVPKLKERDTNRKQVYISLGTILNKNKDFYLNCIEALKDFDMDVIISVGSSINIADLGDIPPNIKVYPRVDQLAVLQETDVFITHCGMNSVSESLYFGVPMVLFPLHSEQLLVANRTKELNAGRELKSTNPINIREAVFHVMEEKTYKESALKISKSFIRAGGFKAGADKIESKILGK